MRCLLLAAAAAVGVAADAPAPVRVMSFNVRYGAARDGDNHWDKRKDFLAATVAAFDPDLLGTQETLAFQRDFLAEKLKTHTAFGAGRDDGKERGEMAALFYRTGRYEKLDGGHFWLSETPDRVSKGWDAALPRIATWVKLKDRTDPTTVLFLNTHFDHMGKQARHESAKLIRTRVAELGAGCRVVVTGDFNADEGSDPYRALFDASLVDAYRAKYPIRGRTDGTFNGFNPAAVTGPRIDWIGVGTGWQVRDAGIDRTTKAGRTPSDHFPVTAVLGHEPANK